MHVELDLSGTVDVAAERKRLEKDLAVAQKELAGCDAKLGNPNFTDKAPAEVVDEDQGAAGRRGRRDRADHRAAGVLRWLSASVMDDLRQVESELNTRWPETKIEPTLQRIAALVDLLGDPHKSYPVLHVAGTNGKTSVTRMIDALLTRIGLRVGRYTSPHLQLVTERIAHRRRADHAGALRRGVPRHRAVRRDDRPRRRGAR